MWRAMLFLDLAHLPPGPLMAVDPGSKTLGIAVCDSNRRVVTPLTTIERTRFTEDAQRLFALYDERKCRGLVIGLPLHMDGGDGRRAQSARSLATNLLRIRDIPIAYQDERLSTADADERLAEAGVPVWERKPMIDAEAAAVILESALAYIERVRNPGVAPDGA